MMRQTFLRCVVFAAFGGSFYRARCASVPPPIDADPGRNTVDVQKKISPRPYCLLAEMGMLGSMLNWPEEVIGGFVETGVSEAWFYRRAHATIYSTLAESWSVRRPCDLITLVQVLRERKQLEEVSGPTYVVELTSCVSTADDACYFRNIVGEKYALRRSLP